MALFPTLRSPYDRDIARLALPAFGSLVAEPLYVLADTAIVGRLGTEELAGLALATTVLLSVFSLLIFLAYGTTSAVARLIGADREAEAAEKSVQGLWLAAGLGVMVALAVAAGDRWLLEFLGGSGRPLEAGLRYLRISLFGLPFLLVTLAGSGAFHGRQDTRTPLLIAVAGAVANLVIELILVPGLGYGIGASALSTVITQVGTGTVFALAMARWVRSTGARLRPDLRAIRSLMGASQALMLRSIGLRGSFTLSAAVAARIGVVELAAHQIILQVWSAFALALDAVAIAGQALTGKWLGAGSVERAKGAARRMIELDVALGVVGGAALIAVRQPLASVFSTDPDVVAATAGLVLWVALAAPLNGYVFALDGILIGAGDMVYLGWSMLAVAAVFGAGCLTLIAVGAGIGALWAAITVFMMMRAVTLWWRWRSDRWVVTGAVRAPA